MPNNEVKLSLILNKKGVSEGFQNIDAACKSTICKKLRQYLFFEGGGMRI